MSKQRLIAWVQAWFIVALILWPSCVVLGLMDKSPMRLTTRLGRPGVDKVAVVVTIGTDGLHTDWTVKGLNSR